MFKKTLLITVSVVAFAASSSAFAQSVPASVATTAAPVAVAPIDANGATASQVVDIVKEQQKNLEVIDVWARASVASSKNSAAYLKINNPTNDEFVVIAATAPAVANNVELHNSFVDEKGVSRMTKVDKIVVPANSSIEMVPGGMHIMLFNLKNTLKVGDKFELNLILEGKDPIKVEGEVKSQ